jgi:predicted GIY-YIG superfamily endonuclease
MKTLVFTILFFIACRSTCVGQQDIDKQASDNLKKIVMDAFAATHDGWSSDEVILQTDLNERFIAECHKSIPDATPQELNWSLMNLRKAGQLKARATQRDSRSVDTVRPIGEMSARMLIDKHGTTIDRIMADPQLRQEFDAAALAIDADVDTYLARKAAFQLRKTRRLRPELITRIADWGRVVTETSVADLATNPEQIPDSPGIYIFRDSTGYLYIGEAVNLRERLKQHLSESDRAALAKYLAKQGGDEILVELHTFDADSRIKEIMVRRAYESELIRSRNPRFNIRP